MAGLSGNENQYDYAIVGGGCFGASTALALIRKWPSAQIIWFEGTHLHTASKDISKIIRATYPDQDYVDFAGKALRIWQTDSLYNEHYHQTGWIQVVSQGSHAYMIKGPDDRMISVRDMIEMIGCQDTPKLENGEKLRFNENIGYADFKFAVEAVAKEASRLGVRREKKDISRMIIDGGFCHGVEAGDHRIVAKKTIVAAGPWTPGLLQKSGVEFPSDFFTVAAVGVATMPLEEKEFGKLESMQILVTEKGEVMPSRQHKLLKITTTSTFRIKHPDDLKDLEYLNVDKNRGLLEKMLPQFAGRRLDWWICPDLMTPYQHPLVDQVPGTGQLYLVVGGSYHSGKFLPIIGDMLVRRLCGQTGSDTLEGRLLERWRWDRSTEKVAIHNSVLPRDD